MEAPTTTSKKGAVKSLPLADFGTASLGSDYTSVSGTLTATVSGVTTNLGLFPASQIQQLVMIGKNAATHDQRAVPSAISTDGTSFQVV